MVPTVAEVVSGAACQPVCQTISESAANVDTPTGKAAACRLARAVVGACCTVALAGAAGAACAGGASPTAHTPTASTAAANPVLIFIPVLSLDPIPPGPGGRGGRGAGMGAPEGGGVRRGGWGGRRGR